MRYINLLVKEPGKPIVERRAQNMILPLANLIGGVVSINNYPEYNFCVLYTLTAERKGKPYNVSIGGVDYYGTIAFANVDDHGYAVDVAYTLDEFLKYANLIKEES